MEIQNNIFELKNVSKIFSGKNGSVNNGVSMVSHWKKLMAITRIKGQATASHTSSAIKASPRLTRFLTSRYTQASIRNTGMV